MRVKSVFLSFSITTLTKCLNLILLSLLVDINDYIHRVYNDGQIGFELFVFHTHYQVVKISIKLSAWSQCIIMKIMISHSTLGGKCRISRVNLLDFAIIFTIMFFLV